MKPGEFVRWNGRSVRALMIQCRYQDGYEAIIGPDSPDYALAVAALQSSIRPSIDPRSGRVLAMGEVLDEDYIDGLRRCRYVSDQPWTRQS